MKGIVVPKEKLGDYVGRQMVSDEWFRITQDRIDAFADATEDHQYIHVDPERAAKTPFGGTIAHGYLTLSLLPRLMEPIRVVPENIVMGINYGLNRLRFPGPVPVDSEIRASATLKDVTESVPNRLLMTTEVVVEVRGAPKPALIAETLAMWVVGG